MSCLVYWPIGTIQLEMRQLSHYTGSKQYAQAADRISHLLEKKQREDPRGADRQTNTRNKRKEESETTRLYCIALHTIDFPEIERGQKSRVSMAAGVD
jgi:hypothetical protein